MKSEKLKNWHTAYYFHILMPHSLTFLINSFEMKLTNIVYAFYVVPVRVHTVVSGREVESKHINFATQ